MSPARQASRRIGPSILNPLWGERRHDALGRVALGYRCRIVDAGGSPVRVGETGEMQSAACPASR
jgi:hypothetical protein